MTHDTRRHGIHIEIHNICAYLNQGTFRSRSCFRIEDPFRGITVDAEFLGMR